MKLLAFSLLVIIGHTSLSAKIRTGVRVNYSVTLNQYLENPLWGSAPSLGIYAGSETTKQYFGFDCSLFYEMHNYIISEDYEKNIIRSDLYYDNLCMNLTLSRKISKKYNLYAAAGLSLKYILQEPVFNRIYNPYNDSNTNNTDQIPHEKFQRFYQGINLELIKKYKGLGIHLSLSDYIFRSIKITQHYKTENSKYEFQILPLEIYFGLSFQLN